MRCARPRRCPAPTREPCSTPPSPSSTPPARCWPSWPKPPPENRPAPGGLAQRGTSSAAGRVRPRAGALVRARGGRHGAARERPGRGPDRRAARVRDRQGADGVRGSAVPRRGQEPAGRGRANREGPAGGVPAARAGRARDRDPGRGRDHAAGRHAPAHRGRCPGGLGARGCRGERLAPGSGGYGAAVHSGTARP